MPKQQLAMIFALVKCEKLTNMLTEKDYTVTVLCIERMCDAKLARVSWTELP